MKAFLNIGFVLLCLGMLWYLFTFNPKSSSEAQVRLENRDTYIDEDFDEGYANTNRSGQVNVESPIDYDEVDDYPSTRKSRGIFDQSDTEEPSNRRRPQEDYDYDSPYASENPYDRRDTYTEPDPAPTSRRTRTSSQPSNSAPTAYGLKYGSKRFSRDNQLGTYKGPMLNGQPHGYGVFEYDNKDLYIGEYRNGQRHGWGNSVYRRSNKVQLRQYVKGKKVESRNVPTVTYGTMRYVHGGSKGTYYGPMKSREPHGFGYFRYDDNSMYIGSYKTGKRDGSGCMVYPDHSINNVKYDLGRKIAN